jgi:hypothetical protein
MPKQEQLTNFGVTPSAAVLLSYLGAATAFILAALSTPILFRESPFGWHALPDIIILLLGGVGNTEREPPGFCSFAGLYDSKQVFGECDFRPALAAH